MADWFVIDNVASIDTPALVIFPERVKKNLDILRSYTNDLSTLRPHVKTNKCAEVSRMMIESGITRFKCATIAEAEMLGTEKASDVLLGYQPQGPKINRFFELQQRFPHIKFSCLVDNEKSLQQILSVAEARQTKVRLFIDLNVGMNRTGIAPGEEAMSLFKAITNEARAEFVGLHAYDGHLGIRDFNERTRRCDEGFALVENLRRNIKNTTGTEPVIVAGGTPTFPIHIKRKGVEASPGTFIFWDRNYQQLLPEQSFEWAALVVTRVISVPTRNTICLDLGHKSIAAENPLANRVYLLNGSDLEPVGQSEEHLVLRSEGEHGYQTNDVFYGVPFHICPTVALYDEAYVCRDGKVTETWPIVSRRRKLTI